MNPTVGQDTLIKNGITSVQGMISIKKNDSFYDLTVIAPEPIFARDFAFALIEELDNHQREYNRAKSTETREFIEDRINDTRQELEAAEESLKDFIVRNRRIENSPALQLQRDRLDREVSVLIGVFTTLKQQLETAKINEVKESSYVVVLDPPEAPITRSKPNKRMIVLVAGILGLIIGLVIAILSELISRLIKDHSDTIKEIKKTIIGSL